MKKIVVGTPQTIKLDQTSIPEGREIKLTIYDEFGEEVLDSELNECSDLVLVYSPSDGFYKKQITIHEETPTGFLRFYFFSSNQEIESIYNPEVYQVVKDIVAPTVEIVPYQFFTQYYLTIKDIVKDEFREAIEIYLEDPTGIQKELLAAQGEMETETELYFAPRRTQEPRDIYEENFSINQWQLEVYHPPIIELHKVKLKYGQTEIVDIDVGLFTYDKRMGIINFLPLPQGDSGGLYNILVTNLGAMGMSVIMGGYLNRVPNFFEIDYTSGIYTRDQDEALKEAIRKAISRRTFMNVIKNLDPAFRQANKSFGLDGASLGKSFRSADQADKMLADEQRFIDGLKKRYGKNVSLVTA